MHRFTSPTLVLSGPLRPPAPLPFRPPLPPADGDWPDACDRHRRQLAEERRRRPQPWSASSLRDVIGEATAAAVGLQATTLDLLDAGRLDEDDPVRAAARLHEGFRLESALALPVEWLPAAPPPTLCAPPRLVDRRRLRQRWARAQAHASRPVKLAILGPLTLAAHIEDAVFGDDRLARAIALAEALAPGLRELAEAGCPALEVVEPCLAAPPTASGAELEVLARLLHRVAPAMQRWLRLVPADTVQPWHDQPVPATDLAPIREALEDLPVDAVVLDAPAALDAIERATWRRLTVAPLVVPATAFADEAVDQGVSWALAAAARLEPRRLALAVDGGGAWARTRLADRLDWLRQIGAALRG